MEASIERLLTVIPVCLSIYYSFTNYDVINDPEFIGVLLLAACGTDSHRQETSSAAPPTIAYPAAALVDHLLSVEQDEVTVVARRAIAAGEEITGDYAVWEAGDNYVLEPCNCGTNLCRGRITGGDWRRPELQKRYAGHFLPYIERRI